MSVIFPGNYVANLNAYRGQGVFAVPGIEFYQVRGVAIVGSDVSGSTTLNPEIQSPDLRQDDKPRLNKALTVPAGATVYRTAIQTVNLSTSGTNAASVEGLTTGTAAASAVASGGAFPAAGDVSDFTGLSGVGTSAESSEAAITVSANTLNIVDPADTAMVIVEVCYFIEGAAPSTDDVSVPYKTESGSGY